MEDSVKKEMQEKLFKECKKIGITLTEKQIQQFIIYYHILIEWNEVMNLTGITEYNDVVQRHFIDSLSIIKVLDPLKFHHVLDIGTGAGFPGIPMKIVYPHLNIVLLDSLNKRIRFLNAAIEKLGLENITAVHGRAEDYAMDIVYREKFDLCVSRAVAKLASLSEYCIPYTIMNGYFISYKSGEIEEELSNAKKAIYLLGGEVKCVEKFILPDSDIERSLIVIEKVKKTSRNYPRKAGLPSKEPLS